MAGGRVDGAATGQCYAIEGSISVDPWRGSPCGNRFATGIHRPHPDGFPFGREFVDPSIAIGTIHDGIARDTFEEYGKLTLADT
jgi:hypothetical protein